MRDKRIKNKLLTFVFCLLAGLPSLSAAIEDSVYQQLASFVTNVEAFNRLYPQEKVYLHFDNTGYYVGERIWYKAYVLSSGTHQYSNYSGILYVELLSQEGQVLETQRLRIEDGSCHGSLELKPDYYAGYYEVRAYTRYMLNFGNIAHSYEKEKAAFFFRPEFADRFHQESGTAFSRVFPVYNSPTEPGGYHVKVMRKRARVTGMDDFKESRRPELSLRFYPEGGSLVEGLPARVAFEARLEDGRHVNISGKVYNADGKVLTNFKTRHRGKGDFYLTPYRKRSERQNVEVHYKGHKYGFDLPEVLREGYVMNINYPYNKALYVKVYKSPGLPPEGLGLCISCRGKPRVFRNFVPDSRGEYTLKVSPQDLPTGVNQVTLFNASGKVYSERLVFINHHEYEACRIEVEGLENTYDPYQEIALDFKVTRKDGTETLGKTETQTQAETKTEIQAQSEAETQAETEARPPGQSFSLAIRDQENEDLTYGLEDVRTNLLLASDLQGFIYDPAYYFAKEDKRRHDELDLLLLVQGWRRYNWEEMSGVVKFKPQYQVEKNLRLEGTVYSPLFKKEVQAGKPIDVTLFMGNLQMHGMDTTDAGGRFHFALRDYTGTANLFLKVSEKKDTTLKTSWFKRTLDSFLKWEENTGDFFEDYLGYELEGGHWHKYFIFLDRVYSPYPKLYSFYEQNIPEYDNRELLKDAPELARSLAATDYSFELPEATVSGRKILRGMDYNQPAIVLDPFEEYNLQTDFGMGWGNVTKNTIGVLASVRLGLRGTYAEVNNRRLENPEYIDKENVHDSLTFPDIITAEDCLLYLNPFSVRGAGMSDVISSKIPDTLKYVKFLTLEHVKQISIYSDKDGREPYSLKEVLKSYTNDFIINYESFLDNSYIPVYKGRRVNLLGYSPECEFYHPDYSDGVLPEQRDYRRTLYWNPDVRT
ncbi:MAG: hypothetical protein WCS66_08360, partial [Bacteroidales bacterium]